MPLMINATMQIDAASRADAFYGGEGNAHDGPSEALIPVIILFQ